MPELPDLLYIRSYLETHLLDRTIRDLIIKQPIVFRNPLDRGPAELLRNQVFRGFDVSGPFLTCKFSDPIELVVNLMLAGKLQHQRPGELPLRDLCCALILDDGSHLNLCDNKKMAKLYLLRRGDEDSVPRYTAQGIDILSDSFSLDAFQRIAQLHSKKQVRVFINDQTILSALGNAYADEVLFEARIHPKTFVGKLSTKELTDLYVAIRTIIQWGREKVAEAGQPIHVKVRDHMRVRNKKGCPCPRCGGTVRREGVRGHDVYFCPRCQPATRKLFLDWQANPR